MDPFRLLTGGTRFKAPALPESKPEKAGPSTSKTTLPRELDFFGTSSASPAPTPPAVKKSKKRTRAVESIPEAVVVDYALLLRQQRIKLTGLEPPSPIPSLAHLVAHQGQSSAEQAARVALLMSNWTRELGLATPTAVQMAAWGIMLADRDALVCAPTGSGKTLAFALPLLVAHPPLVGLPLGLPASAVLRPTSLILEPTRELAMQVWRQVNVLGSGGGWTCTVLGEEERVAKVQADQDKKLLKNDQRKAKKLKLVEEPTIAVPALDSPASSAALPTATDVLITTPLRLIFALQNKTVDLSDVLHLILDESDKLFELNFIEQTDEIIAACSNPALRKGMFSATMSSTVEDIAKGVMAGGGVGMVRAIVGQKDAATTTIAQSLQFVGTEEHKLLALRTLITSGQFTPPVLIFVQSILRAKELAAELLFDGINADCIHADRTPEERDETVRAFATGELWCLICTDVMSRGVDYQGVKLVINYDFPQSGGSYIHRIGRTGRAGKSGKSITFFTKDDAPQLKSIVNVMRSSGCEVPQFMLDMPNPSQRLKKALSLKPVNRQDVRQTNGGGQTRVGGKRKVERTRVMGGQLKDKTVKVKGGEKNIEITE